MRQHIVAFARSMQIREAADREVEARVSNYLSQVREREADLLLIREQYAAVQSLYKARVGELKARCARATKQLRALERRRRLEIEGFLTDTKLLRDKVVRAPAHQAGRQAGSRGRLARRIAGPPPQAREPCLRLALFSQMELSQARLGIPYLQLSALDWFDEDPTATAELRQEAARTREAAAQMQQRADAELSALERQVDRLRTRLQSARELTAERT